MSELIGIRYVVRGGVKYLREEDVALYLRGLAATENTDTRNRLNAAADQLLKKQAV